MAIFVPDVRRKGITPEELTARQGRSQTNTPEAQAFAAQIQGLPSYHAYLQTLIQGARGSQQNAAYQAVMAEAQASGIHIPDDLKMDTSGSVREKSWGEKHQILQAALITGGFLGGGFALGAALAPAAAGTVGALGPTTAAGMAGTEAAAAGAGVPASLAGSGFGSGITSGLAGAAGSGIPGIAGTAPAAGAGVGIGETSAMTGVAGSGFGPAVLPSAATAAGGGIPAASLTGGTMEAAGAGGTLPTTLGQGASMANVGTTAGKGALGLSPEMWQILASSGAGYLRDAASGKNAQAQIAAQIASTEAGRDPFHQQMSQIQNLGRLDAMEQMKPIQRAAPVGKYAGVVAPGAIDSYAPSADMLAWLASMKRDVSSGKNTAPTMTNPNNYGKTSVLNLMPPGAAQPGVQPGAQPSLYSSTMTLEEMLKQLRDPSNAHAL